MCAISEQEKALCSNLHKYHWLGISNQSEQDAYIYERLEDGSEDWSGESHMKYVSIARSLLSKQSFENIDLIFKAVVGDQHL